MQACNQLALLHSIDPGISLHGSGVLMKMLTLSVADRIKLFLKEMQETLSAETFYTPYPCMIVAGD